MQSLSPNSQSSFSASSRKNSDAALLSGRSTKLALTDDRAARVLVLDDEPDVLEIFTQLLCDEGYWVTTSTRLLELELLKQASPNLIVLDLVFDGVPSGLDYLTTFRDDPELTLIPVIVCTGAKFLLDVHALTNPVANFEIVEKPFDLEEILAAVERCLQSCPEPAAS
jgi:CheY-like chemotaxis protein